MSQTLVQRQQKLSLLNAHTAVESQQPLRALTFLAELDPDLDQLPLALLKNYYAIRGEANVNLRRCEEGRSDLQKALQILEADFPNKPDYLEIERLRNRIGLSYYYESRPLEALKVHLVCYEAVRLGRVTTPRFLFSLFSNLGNEYYLTHQYEQALSFYRRAANLIEDTEATAPTKGENHLALAGVYWGMGLVYQRQSNFDWAKIFFARSADLYQEVGATKLFATVNNLLGWVMTKNGELEEAEEKIRQSLGIALDQSEPDGYSLATIYGNLAYVYHEMQRWLPAQEAGQASVEWAERTGDRQDLGQNLMQLAEINFGGNLTVPTEILRQVRAAVDVMGQTEVLTYKYLILHRAAHLCRKLGELELAFDYLERSCNFARQETIANRLAF